MTLFMSRKIILLSNVRSFESCGQMSDAHIAELELLVTNGSHSVDV